jgi:acyl carrier protein
MGGLRTRRPRPVGLARQRVGVYTGATSQGYGPELRSPVDGYGGYLLTGSTASVASGRVAYALGLEGPAVTVDTACSSSLVAMREIAGPDTLEGLVVAAAAEQAVTEIVYAVSMPDDGAVASWPAADFSSAVRRAMDTILHLDGLAREQEGPELVLLSSAAGILGDGKRVGLAALSAVMEALGRDRARRGFATRSLAWGGQGEAARDSAEETAAASGERQTDMRRAFTFLESFGEVVGGTVLAGVEWNVPALRRQAAASKVPPLFRLPFPARPRVPQSAAAQTEPGPENWLADLTGQELDSRLLDLVHINVATVLGHASKDVVPADAVFRDLGIDSMTAVDLRNRISAATGLKLRVTMVFEHPSCQALAQYLKESLRLQLTGLHP